jgi:hypothetical protein
MAKGRLAWAQGDLPQCQKEYDEAVAAWKQRYDLVRAQYNGGTVDYLALSAAQSLQHDAELFASRVKARIARGANNAQPREGPAKEK